MLAIQKRVLSVLLALSATFSVSASAAVSSINFNKRPAAENPADGRIYDPDGIFTIDPAMFSPGRIKAGFSVGSTGYFLQVEPGESLGLQVKSLSASFTSVKLTVKYVGFPSGFAARNLYAVVDDDFDAASLVEISSGEGQAVFDLAESFAAGVHSLEIGSQDGRVGIRQIELRVEYGDAVFDLGRDGGKLYLSTPWVLGQRFAKGDLVDLQWRVEDLPVGRTYSVYYKDEKGALLEVVNENDDGSLAYAAGLTEESSGFPWVVPFDVASLDLVFVAQPQGLVTTPKWFELCRAAPNDAAVIAVKARLGYNDCLPAALKLRRATELALSGAAIRNLAWIADLTQLRTVDLSQNLVADLSPLAELKGLVELNLAKNQLTALTSLAGLTELRKLNVSGNRIDSVEPLRGATRLESLDVSDNRIRSLAGLQTKPGIKFLPGNYLCENGLGAGESQSLDLPSGNGMVTEVCGQDHLLSPGTVICKSGFQAFGGECHTPARCSDRRLTGAKKVENLVGGRITLTCDPQGEYKLERVEDLVCNDGYRPVIDTEAGKASCESLTPPVLPTGPQAGNGNGSGTGSPSSGTGSSSGGTGSSSGGTGSSSGGTGSSSGGTGSSSGGTGATPGGGAAEPADRSPKPHFCRDSGSDSDGDGFGFENGDICVVMLEIPNVPSRSGFTMHAYGGSCLDSQAGLGRGRVEFAGCDGSAPQAWSYVGANLRSHDDRCLEVYDDSGEDQSRIRLARCNGSADQLFIVDFASGVVQTPRRKCVRWSLDTSSQPFIWYMEVETCIQGIVQMTFGVAGSEEPAPVPAPPPTPAPAGIPAPQPIPMPEPAPWSPAPSPAPMPVAPDGHPWCSDASSDSDGDMWGWENEMSCHVRPESRAGSCQYRHHGAPNEIRAYDAFGQSRSCTRGERGIWYGQCRDFRPSTDEVGCW
jgi:hypothetical protein